VFFQGIYLLTSIGLNITKRTQYYPVATMTAAAANVGLNIVLIPRLGIVGAAWANGAAYAVQAGLAYVFSQRFYPVRYEYGRLFRAVAAALIGYVVAKQLPAMPPAAGILARGATVVAMMSALLWLTRFFNADEIRALNSLRLRRDERQRTPPAETTELAGEIVSVEVPDEPDRQLERNA